MPFSTQQRLAASSGCRGGITVDSSNDTVEGAASLGVYPSRKDDAEEGKAKEDDDEGSSVYTEIEVETADYYCDETYNTDDEEDVGTAADEHYCCCDETYNTEDVGAFLLGGGGGGGGGAGLDFAADGSSTCSSTVAAANSAAGNSGALLGKGDGNDDSKIKRWEEEAFWLSFRNEVNSLSAAAAAAAAASASISGKRTSRNNARYRLVGTPRCSNVRLEVSNTPASGCGAAADSDDGSSSSVSSFDADRRRWRSSRKHNIASPHAPDSHHLLPLSVVSTMKAADLSSSQWTSPTQAESDCSYVVGGGGSDNAAPPTCCCDVSSRASSSLHTAESATSPRYSSCCGDCELNGESLASAYEDTCTRLELAEAARDELEFCLLPRLRVLQRQQGMLLGKANSGGGLGSGRMAATAFRR